MAWMVHDYPEPRDEDRGAVCPVCDRACYKIFRRGLEILGCEECIEEVDADDVDECFDYPGGRR